MSIHPLPLTVKDITDVVEAHPLHVDRATLDACVFAIDNYYLNEINESRAAN